MAIPILYDVWHSNSLPMKIAVCNHWYACALQSVMMRCQGCAYMNHTTKLVTEIFWLGCLLMFECSSTHAHLYLQILNIWLMICDIHVYKLDACINHRWTTCIAHITEVYRYVIHWFWTQFHTHAHRYTFGQWYNYDIHPYRKFKFDTCVNHRWKTNMKIVPHIGYY